MPLPYCGYIVFLDQLCNSLSLLPALSRFSICPSVFQISLFLLSCLILMNQVYLIIQFFSFSSHFSALYSFTILTVVISRNSDVHFLKYITVYLKLAHLSRRSASAFNQLNSICCPPAFCAHVVVHFTSTLVICLTRHCSLQQSVFLDIYLFQYLSVFLKFCVSV